MAKEIEYANGTVKEITNDDIWQKFIYLSDNNSVKATSYLFDFLDDEGLYDSFCDYLWGKGFGY